MGQIIKKFADNSFVEYSRGNFDDWCVYLSRPQCKRKAPKDNEYFQVLKNTAAVHASDKLYNHFVSIYNRTTKHLDQSVLDLITNIASEYGHQGLELDINLTIIYLGMIAEENRVNTMLGKRIKRLGIHQILLDGESADFAAKFSRGKKWKEIEAECKSRGF